jgi:biotin carboxylase
MNSKRRKILMLGGAYSQIPAIEQAKEEGYYVITCDYLPDNPGHKLADEYHNISTVDIEEVIRLAKRLEVDGVVAYSSDPAALTAAYVSEALGLPGASVQSVETLSRKDMFRKFQEENDFASVKHVVVCDAAGAGQFIDWDYPVVVKPVDSSGSKGVTVVSSWNHLTKAIEDALDYTRCGRVIVEEFIHTEYHHIQGDGFVYQGKLVFTGLCDAHHIGIVPLVDVFPSTLPKPLMTKVEQEVGRLLKAVGFDNGAVNIEVRIRPDGEIVVVEIGARCGGCYVPQHMQLATGFNEVKAIIDLAMGKPVEIQRNSYDTDCLSHVLCSQKAGYFEAISLDPEISELVEQLYVHLKPGDYLESFDDASKIVGEVLARYNDQYDYQTMIKHFAECVKIKENYIYK